MHLDRIVTSAAIDRDGAAGLFDVDTIVACAGHEDGLHRLQNPLHVDGCGLEGELVIPGSQADIEVFNSIEQHPVDWQGILPNPARGLPQAFQAAIGVVE